MKLKKYNQFIGLSLVNENLEKSKKFIKDNFVLNSAVNKIGLVNLLGDNDAKEIKYEMEEGHKRSLTPSDFINIDAEKKKLLTDEMRSIKVSDDKLRELINTPTFKEIRELSVDVKASDGVEKVYQLDRDNIAWLYNFVYFYYYENLSIDDLRGLYTRLLENKDMLNKLEINENGKLVERPFDLNYINIRIKNNAELLDDALAKIPNQRIYKKYEADLPSHLKRDLKTSPQIIKDQFLEVAIGFDMLFKDSSGKMLTDKEELDKADKNYKGFWGQMLEDRRQGSPTFGQQVFQSPISRYKNIRDLIENAKGYLKGLGNSQFESFYALFNECNIQFGNAGATQMFLDKGIFIIEVKSFGANKILNAHTSHCIKDSLNYWNQYVNQNNRYEFVEENKQYYIYNFNLMPSEQLWTIGVTIEPEDRGNGYVRAAHDKIDRPVNPIEILKKWEKEYDLTEDATKRAKELGATDEEIKKYGALFSIMRPLTGEEFEKKKIQRAANMEIVKPDLSIEKIKELVTVQGADINRDKCIVLLHAVKEDDVEKATLILNLGGSPNLREGKKDQIINSAKSIEMIKLLVKRGSDITPEVYNNICYDVEAVRFCLDSGVDPNFDNSVGIRRACKGSYVDKDNIGHSYFDTIKLLIQYGAKLEDDNGKMMIFKWAGEYNRIDVIEYVLDMGAVHGFVSGYAWLAHHEKLNKEDAFEIGKLYFDLAKKHEPAQLKEWGESSRGVKIYGWHLK